jgi:hypothetical protein
MEKTILIPRRNLTAQHPAGVAPQRAAPTAVRGGFYLYDELSEGDVMERGEI